MDLGLTEKIVLVTGGSKGIGLACARTFITEGAKVVICLRDPNNIARAQAELPGLYAAFAADLRVAPDAEAMIARVEADVGPVDVLVNSAGAARRTPVRELTPALWRDAFDAKFFSYEALAKLPAEDCLRSQFGLGCGGFGIAVLAFAPRLVDFP